MQKRIKFTCQSTKQLKLESYLSNLPRTYAPCHPDRSPGRHTASAPVGLRACSLSSATHDNNVRVQQPAKGPHLHVDAGPVSLTAPVDILPLTLINWMDHRPILPAPSRWSQERVSQPRKIELVTSYKNEYK
jgi:hypothetical protein